MLGFALLGAGGVLTREQALVASLAAMAFAGAADSVSAVFRTTILQTAAPDRMRGRLQGVFIVVVAGGPRLGELLGGGVAERLGEGWTAVAGGAACLLAVVVLSLRQPGFLRRPLVLLLFTTRSRRVLRTGPGPLPAVDPDPVLEVL